MFEDSIGAKTIATVPRFWARNNHINIKYWHFIEYVEKGLIDIQSVKSRNQLADILTKPLPEADFSRLRDIILGHPKYNTSTFQESMKNNIMPVAENAEGEIGRIQRDEALVPQNEYNSKRGGKVKNSIEIACLD